MKAGWQTVGKKGFKTGYNLYKLSCIISFPATSALTVELNDYEARAKLLSLFHCICQNENSLNDLSCLRRLTSLAQESILSPWLFKFGKHKIIPNCCCPFTQLLYALDFWQLSAHLHHRFEGKTNLLAWLQPALCPQLSSCVGPWREWPSIPAVCTLWNMFQRLGMVQKEKLENCDWLIFLWILG